MSAVPNAILPAPVSAILRPKKPKQQTWTVTLLARTGNGKVRVRLPSPALTTFAVDRFRLFRIDERTLQVTAAVLDALPWEGKGSDPLLKPRAEKSAGLPLTDLPLIGDPV